MATLPAKPAMKDRILETADRLFYPQGIRAGGYGLSLQPRDMAKIGYLYLQRGQWAGQRIVAEVLSGAAADGIFPAADTAAAATMMPCATLHSCHVRSPQHQALPRLRRRSALPDAR